MEQQVDVLMEAMAAVTAATALAERMRMDVDGATVEDPQDPSVRVLGAEALLAFSEAYRAVMLADRDAQLAVRGAHTQDALIAGQLDRLFRAQQDMESAVLRLTRLFGPMLAQVPPSFAKVAPMEFAGVNVRRPPRLPQRAESVPRAVE